MESSIVLNEYQGWLPILTSKAGGTLTEENWSAAKVGIASFHLETLLMKPGVAFLTQLQSFKRFSGWNSPWVLNASLPKDRGQDRYVVRSTYDGRVSHYTPLGVLDLIRTLKPNGVVLPQGLWPEYQDECESLQEMTSIFVPAVDLKLKELNEAYGVYIDIATSAQEGQALINQLDAYRGHRCYIAGMIDLASMLKLVSCGDVMIESDIPAQLAILGQVYSQGKLVNLKDAEMALSFEPIDTHCSCPVCQEPFTRSYFHHLLEHTPLLCQRYLVQHNAHYTRVSV